MKRSFAFGTLAAILLCGCSGPVPPAGPSPVGPGIVPLDAATQSVPLKGRFEGTQTLTPLQPPLASVNGVGTGNATHLGRFTVEFPHTVNFATRAGIGTYTFTAANGDTLTATFTGQAQGSPIVSIVEQGTITGGTGRFEGASGSFTVQRQFNQATGTTVGSFEGTVSSVGSNKS